MGLICTLLPRATHLQRVKAAARDSHAILECEDWAALTRACEARPVQAAILDLFADGRAAVDGVRIIKSRFPSVALLAYVSVTAERAHDLFEAARAGIDGLIVADVDDTPRAIQDALERVQSRTLAGVVRRALGPLKQPAARDAVLAAVTRAHDRLTPELLARRLAVPRRLLAKRLRDAGFPPPHRLITWGRLVVAARMLEDAQRTADAVAAALDFPSGSAFRNTCQRYLHATPGEIRSRGGAGYALRVFLREVRSAQPVPRPQTSTRMRAPLLAV